MKIVARNKITDQVRTFYSAQEMADELGVAVYRIKTLFSKSEKVNGRNKRYKVKSVANWSVDSLERDVLPLPPHCWRCKCGATVANYRKDCPICGKMRK